MTTTPPLADVIKELRPKAEKALANGPDWRVYCEPEQLIQLLTAAEKAERYERALRFYADKDTWYWYDLGHKNKADHDRGKKAQQALAPEQEGVK